MNLPLSADVVVIGLGPAGASAAAKAAQHGLKVIGVDRKRVAGIPVQCAEFVPALATTICDVTRVSRQSVSAMMTMIEDGSAHTTAEFRGSMIDRAAFDSLLVDEADRAGACVLLDANVASLEGGYVQLNDGRRIDAAVIIGADGPRSIVGRAIGAVNTELAETRQITVRLRTPHTATDIFLSADYPGGYAWLFPKGAVANIGIGLEPAYRQRLKGLLDHLHARLVAEGRVDQEILKWTGGAIPVGGMLCPIGEISGRPVLLAGDAVGLANPVTGAGIASAVQSGAMAGEAAAAICGRVTGALQHYAEDLVDLFWQALDRARIRRLELLSSYVGPARPTLADLRRGWIAFPEYWAPNNPIQDPRASRIFA